MLARTGGGAAVALRSEPKGRADRMAEPCNESSGCAREKRKSQEHDHAVDFSDGIVEVEDLFRVVK